MSRQAFIGIVGAMQVGIVAFTAAVSRVSAAEHVFTDLGIPGQSSAAYAINNAGQVVGSSTIATGETHAFLWSGGQIRDLGTLGGPHSQAFGINDLGQVVGSSRTAGGTTHAFLYANGTMIDLGTLRGGQADFSSATDINNAGTIVGYSSSPGVLPHAFKFSNGAMTDLGSLPGPYPQGAACKINNPGAVVGQSNDRNNQPHAVVYLPEGISDLGALGGPFSFANGINDRGEIVGHVYLNYVASSAFLYSGGVMRPLGTLGGNYSSARAINASGIIVGESRCDDRGPPNAFLYVSGAMMNLNQIPGWLIETANAINDHGQIVGTAIANGGRGIRHAYLLTPLAETAETFSSVPRLAHISIRGNVGADNLIVGFVIGGTRFNTEKAVLLRGVGPTLREFGLGTALAAPVMTLLRGAKPMTQNDGWRGEFDFAAVGAFDFSGDPPGDAAIFEHLAPGGYSVQISGKNNSNGIVMAELYDATPLDAYEAVTPRLLNVSARAYVGTGDDIVIAGFVVSGSGPVRLLIRSVGPTLAGFGIGNSLSDPVLTVFGPNSDDARFAGNNDWEAPVDATAASAIQLRSAFAQAGAFLLSPGSRDAAVLGSFQPGAYTAHFSGVDGATGIALVEIYEIP